MDPDGRKRGLAGEPSLTKISSSINSAVFTSEFYIYFDQSGPFKKG